MKIIKASDDYAIMKRNYKHSKEFKDRDKESGHIRDLTDQLEGSGCEYQVYDNKKDNGCTIFYDADIESASRMDPREYAFRAFLSDWLEDLDNDIQSGSIDDFSSDEEFEAYVYDELVNSDYWWSAMSRDCAEFVQAADESLISSIIKEETDKFYS